MRIAQRVLAVVVGIRPPAIMHGHPRERGQDVEAVQRLLAALGVLAIPGQPCGRSAMQPLQRASNPHARLIKVHHRLGQNRLADLLERRGQGTGGLVDAVLNGARAYRQPEQISQGLRCPVDRHLLILRQIDRCRLDSGAILRRLAYPRRELTSMGLAAAALRDLHTMLGDLEADGR